MTHLFFYQSIKMNHDSFSFYQPIKIDHAIIFSPIYIDNLFFIIFMCLFPLIFFVITSILCVLKAQKFNHLVVDYGIDFLFYLYLILIVNVTFSGFHWRACVYILRLQDVQHQQYNFQSRQCFVFDIESRCQSLGTLG